MSTAVNAINIDPMMGSEDSTVRISASREKAVPGNPKKVSDRAGVVDIQTAQKVTETIQGYIDRMNVSLFSINADNSNTARNNINSMIALCIFSLPAARARFEVRGLSASISRSAMRLKSIAALRADNTAAMIHNITPRSGNPSAAIIAAITAKDSENTLCGISSARHHSINWFLKLRTPVISTLLHPATIEYPTRALFQVDRRLWLI